MKSYLVFLLRNALFAVIQALGLVVSMAFVIIAGNYLWQQYSVAYENPKGECVFAIMGTSEGSHGGETLALSWWDKEVIEDNLPEAVSVCRISSPDYEAEMIVGNETMDGSLNLADPSFFGMFPNYRIIDGSLDDYKLPGRCLVSESFARKVSELAGEEVIGTRITVSDYYGERNLTICGVYGDFDNTMVPPSDVLENPEYHKNDNEPFGSIGNYLTLMEVSPDTDRDALAKKTSELCRKNYSEDFVESFVLMSLPEMYFNEYQYHFMSGNVTMMKMLLAVVLLIFVSAVFNYIDLSLALSGKRAREMATRRLLGASRFSVMAKYVSESVVFTFICFLLAFLLAKALLPVADDLIMRVSVSDMEYGAWQFLHLNLDMTPSHIAVYMLMVIVVGTLTGLFPAVVASRFSPIDVVRGVFSRKSKMLFGKIFIVFQNTLSVILISLAILMDVQLSYMESRPINARSEGLYRLSFVARSYDDVRPLIDRLKAIPQVTRVAYGVGFPGQMNMGTGFRMLNGENIMTQVILCEKDYFDMLGLRIIKDYGTPASGSVWMSESLAAKVGLNDTTSSYYAEKFGLNGFVSKYIGGIYEDIPAEDASASHPNKLTAVCVGNPEDIKYCNGVMIDVSGDFEQAGEAVREAYAQYSEERNGEYVQPWDDGYVSDLLNILLMPIRTTLRLVEVFMVISVLISLLGLFAMSTYFSSENTREIAIRKVFGSDVWLEMKRTVLKYMFLVFTAVVIGLPVAVAIGERYLSQFVYRINGVWWIFVLGAVMTFILAFVSVYWQTMKAALTNPASELKKE